MSDTEKVLGNLKVTIQSATVNEQKTKRVDDVSHEKMDEFVESHKSTAANQRDDTCEKNTNDAIPFGFSTTQREWHESQQKMEQFSSDARYFTATAASKAVDAATQAATAAATAATTASVGIEAATREVSKQFKVMTEEKKQKTRPVGNFRQKVGYSFSFLEVHSRCVFNF